MSEAYLPKIPPLDAVELLSYDQVIQEVTARLLELSPQLADVLVIQSEPLNKLNQVWAEREINLRQRINDGVRATMLASANGADLESIGQRAGVEKLPGEKDDSYRLRIWLAKDKLSTAGSKGSYEYHARSASVDVKDVRVTSPAALQIVIPVLSHASTNGTASAELIATVAAALLPDDVIPQDDQVTVVSAEIVSYTIEAEIEVETGQPDEELVRTNAIAAVQAYADEQHGLGQKISQQKLYSSLDVAGVNDLTITQPASFTTTDLQSPFCTAINITIAGAA